MKYIVIMLIFLSTVFMFAIACRVTGLDNLEGFGPVIGIFITMTYASKVTSWIKNR